MGFTTSPIHEFRCEGLCIFGTPKLHKAPVGTCPTCDLRGQYDGNTIRMILGTGAREVQRKWAREALVNAMTQTGAARYGGEYGYGDGANPRIAQDGLVGSLGAGQVLTPYQQQFAANRAAVAGASLQYFPMIQNYHSGRYGGSSCSIM